MCLSVDSDVFECVFLYTSINLLISSIALSYIIDDMLVLSPPMNVSLSINKESKQHPFNVSNVKLGIPILLTIVRSVS